MRRALQRLLLGSRVSRVHATPATQTAEVGDTVTVTVTWTGRTPRPLYVGLDDELPSLVGTEASGYVYLFDTTGPGAGPHTLTFWLDTADTGPHTSAAVAVVVPALASAALLDDGDTLHLTFNVPVWGSTGVTLTASGGAATLHRVPFPYEEEADGRLLHVRADRTILAGETLTVSYAAGNIVTRSLGTAVAGFSGAAVTNGSPFTRAVYADAALVAATTTYNPATGNPATGSATAYPTLHAAYDSAGPADTVVYVKPGTYAETDGIGGNCFFIDKHIVFRGTSPDPRAVDTTFDPLAPPEYDNGGTPSLGAVWYVHYYKLVRRNLTVTGTKALYDPVNSDTDVATFVDGGGGLSDENVITRGFGHAGYKWNAVGAGIDIHRCRVRDGGFTQRDHGFYTNGNPADGAGVNITNTVTEGASGYGMQLYASPEQFRVYGCVLFRNLYGGAVLSGRADKLRFNTFAYNGRGGPYFIGPIQYDSLGGLFLYDGASGNTVTYNLFRGNKANWNGAAGDDRAVTVAVTVVGTASGHNFRAEPVLDSSTTGSGYDASTDVVGGDPEFFADPPVNWYDVQVATGSAAGVSPAGFRHVAQITGADAYGMPVVAFGPAAYGAFAPGTPPVTGPGPAGILAYWKFDGDATDANGALALTPNNAPTYVAGHLYAQAAHLTAASSQTFSRAVGVLQSGQIDRTYVAGVYLDTNSGEMTICTNGYPGDILRVNGGKFEFVSGTLGIVRADTFGTVPTGQWILVAAWRDATAGSLNIRVNGGAVDSAADTSGASAGSLFQVGYRFGGDNWNGRIGPLFVANRVYTTAELDAIYAGGAWLPYPLT